MRIGEATNERDLISALETARTRRLDLRRGYETLWWNNIALVGGDHQASWNPTLSKFEDRDPNLTDTGEKKPMMVINHALTIGRTELAKMTKSHPVMEIIANSDEPTDISATKVGKAALEFAEWKFKLRKKRKAALWWMIQTGLGAIFVGYDYLNGDAGAISYLIDPTTNEAVFSETRKAEIRRQSDAGELDAPNEESFPLGELEYKVYSPFQLLPDETAVDFDEIKDLITTEIVDIDVLRGIYGRAADDLKPDSNLQLGVMEQRALARAGVPGSTGSGDTTVQNGVAVHTYWLLPNVYRGNKLLKKGLFVRWTSGDKQLDKSDGFAFNDERMPFTFFQHIPSSTSIWPDSIMTHIRGPNLEIDKTVSQLIENKDFMANPMWRIATQHKVKGEVRNVAGAIIRYRHVPNVPPPEPVQGLEMPRQVENLMAGLREQILDVSGQSEVTRGRVPTGARSGVAVAYMQEEDDSKIAPTIEGMEESIALMGSLTLSRFSQFYSIPRTLRFYRRDGIFDVRKFKGADLKNNTDVVCQAGSAMPKSKAAKQDYAIQLIQLGVLQDPHKIMEILELGAGEPDETDKAIAQADRENNTMLHGTWVGQHTASDVAAVADTTPGDSEDSEEGGFKKTSTAMPVKKWHNHQVHVQRHTSIMMDEEFDRLAISNPEVVRLFDEHLAMHQHELDAQKQEEMKMLLAAKGAPDGPPGNSGGEIPSSNGNAPAQGPVQGLPAATGPEGVAPAGMETGVAPQ